MRSFAITILVVWGVLATAGILYAEQQHIPEQTRAVLLPVILLEAVFYLAPGFPAVRRALTAIPAPLLAGFLVKSAIAPWLLFAALSGTFHWSALALLLALVIPAAYWYVWMPRVFLVDISLLALFAGVFLSKVWPAIYVAPWDGKPAVDFLGKYMWVRLGIAAFLLLRRPEGVEFGFVPTAEEWRSGLRHYLRFLPFGLTCGYGLGMLELAPFTQPWWMVPLLMIGVFCGALWFIALFEEFFFRGLLLPWISDLAGSPLTGLAVSSLLFGLAHLPFRGPWNWRHAILTTILGWFCGQAYQEAKGIRAPMVTHALVVMTWIVLFGKN